MAVKASGPCNESPPVIIQCEFATSCFGCSKCSGSQGSFRVHLSRIYFMLEPRAIHVRQDVSSWVVKKHGTQLIYKIKFHHWQTWSYLYMLYLSVSQSVREIKSLDWNPRGPEVWTWFLDTWQLTLLHVSNGSSAPATWPMGYRFGWMVCTQDF